MPRGRLCFRSQVWRGEAVAGAGVPRPKHTACCSVYRRELSIKPDATPAPTDLQLSSNFNKNTSWIYSFVDTTRSKAISRKPKI